jgi:hypothetical protein
MGADCLPPGLILAILAHPDNDIREGFPSAVENSFEKNDMPNLKLALR